MMDWLSQNREWVFSGIGIFILGGVGAIIKYVLKRKKLPNTTLVLKQENTKGSSGTQIGIQNNYGGKKDE